MISKGNTNYEEFTYTAPFNSSLRGYSFRVSQRALKTLNFPISQSKLVTLTDESANDFVIVTGASSGFYGGLVHTIIGARQFLPQHDIIVYDLGLTSQQVLQVSGLLVKDYCKCKLI